MPVGALLVWVLGVERAKAGDMPNDSEHREMRRLLHEAMDAGAGGWSAQRLEPGCGTEVQRDFDGTPMVSDVMRDETCLQLAEVLAERNEGFIQMTLSKADGSTLEHLEKLAETSGRPLLWNVVLPFDNNPDIHRSQLAWLKACRERGLPIYGQGVTTDAGFTFSFDEWNLFDEVQAWCDATTGTVQERLQKLSDPERRPALRENRPWITLSAIEKIVVAETFCEETKPYVNETIGDIAEKLGKDPVDALLDIAVADGLKATFFSLPANSTLEGFRELMLDPYVLTRSFRRRRSHSLPDSRPIPDGNRSARVARQRHPLARGSTLEAVGASGPLRWVQGTGARSRKERQQTSSSTISPASASLRWRRRTTSLPASGAEFSEESAIATSSSTAKLQSKTTRRQASQQGRLLRDQSSSPPLRRSA